MIYNGRLNYCPRVRGQKFFKDFQSYFNQYDDNFIEELKISMMKQKCSNYLENANFGTEFENCICPKTCINTKAQSINEKTVYTKKYRKFFGLKILVTKAYSNKKYKSKLLREGKFRVIPFSNNFFKISLKGYDAYKLSYNNEGITIESNKIRKKILLRNIDFSGDGYNGNYPMYKKGIISDLNIVLYVSSCQIDGLFNVIKDINLSVFQASEIYNNKNEDIIKPNSLMVFEIKSGL